MPGKKLKSCERKVRAKIQDGTIPKTYKCGKKRCKSNEFAICQARKLGVKIKS